MKSIPVSLADNSYSILIGSVSKDLSRYLKAQKKHPSNVLIVTSHSVKKAGLTQSVQRAFASLKVPVSLYILPDGESQKNLSNLTKLYEFTLKQGLDRASWVVAVGGGVVTDMAGFLAATYMRGIPYVSFPTTLLGMVDASIGGKTGVDLAKAKNIVGSFWQPTFVWIDSSFLKTLPSREWKTGMAEVVKYGIIKDPQFFKWLEKKVSREKDVRKWSRTDLDRAIWICAAIKARVVSDDVHERPMAGGREILNFGHTIGHALEAATEYKAMTHGEAISIGMVCVGQMALAMKLWSVDAQRRMVRLFYDLGLPVHVPTLTRKQTVDFWDALRKDKKNIAGRLRFVIPKKLGQVFLKNDIPTDLVKKSMQIVAY